MEGAEGPRQLNLELRSRTLPPVMTTNVDQPAPSAQSGSGTGVPRLRDPKVFSGAGETDVEDWFTNYELVSAHNKWDDADKLTHVVFYLTDVAEMWYHNHKSDIPTWSVFKTSFAEVFGRPAVRKFRAEQRLRTRAQKPSETFTSYIEDIIDLCNRVNAAMPESDKIQHILKGIDDGAFQMLLARNPRTVSEVVTLCQSYDELRKQRALTRPFSSHADSLSSLGTVPEHSPTLQEIKDFVREEVARQLSLVPFTQEPPSRLPPTLRTVIAEEVAQAVPVAHHQQSVAAPLTYAPVMQPVASPITYAQVVRRPPQQPYPPMQQYAHRSAPLPTSWAEPRVSTSWRTPDNRPICYACGTPGHVARYCRRRFQTYSDATRPFQYGAHPMRPSPTGPSPSDAYTDHPDFPSRRSPSPRRRSLSPMRRRPGPSNQEN